MGIYEKKQILISIANKMIGIPYKYGEYVKARYKTKPEGVDCSSLIQYVFSCIDIDLPRSSILQATKGKEIKKEKDLQVGDLIFFETTKGHYWHSLFSSEGRSASGENNKKYYIGHVSLYVGNGEIIDASEDRNGGCVARMKLSELTKKPEYKIKLIKRIIGVAEPQYIIPTYSQYLDVASADWQNRACGIVSLKMVMDFWGKKTKIIYPTIDDLISKYSKSTYISKVGWSHKGLVTIAKHLKLKGENFDWINYSAKDAFVLMETKLALAPVIASIYKNLNHRLPGHLIVITQIKNGKVFYNDPDSKTRNKIKCVASLQKFLEGWKRRIIIIHR